MVDKLVLMKVLQSYHLGGNVEKAKWNVEDQNLKIRFINDSQNLVGEVECSNIPLPNGSFGIYDTATLIKMVSILEFDVAMDVVKENGMASKFMLADTNVDLKYNLADPQVIPTTPVIKGADDVLFNLNITNDFISKFVKSRDAINQEQFQLEVEEGFAGMELVITVGTKSTNTIKFSEPLHGEAEPTPTAIPFDGLLFKDILKTNKDFQEGCISLNPKGMLIAEFNHGEVASKYYLVRNQKSE